MTDRRWIYLAGPYQDRPDALARVQAIEAAQQLIEAGHWPIFHPNFYASLDRFSAYPEATAMIVRVCHAVLRLPGDSLAADGEMLIARRLGVSIAYSVEDCLAACPATEGARA